MNTMKELLDAYATGSLPKARFIDEMYAFHSTLFQYAQRLPQTDISRIEITDGEICMTIRGMNIKMLPTAQDKRDILLEIINFGGHEREELTMVERLVPDGACLLDIGANVGWYALWLARKKPSLTIHSFEPIPKTFARLAQHVALNGLDEQVKTYPFGFSDVNETLTFYFAPECSMNASSRNVADRADIERIDCRVMPLDEFMADKPFSVDFLKCDVEGAELFVYRGGLKTLAEHKPIVFSEMLRKWASKFDYHPNEIIALFKELGYGCFALAGQQLRRFAFMDEGTLETNFFFLHHERHADLIKALVAV